MHRLFLHNGQVRDVEEPVISAGQAGFLTGWGIFSTLRVANCVLFAFERHYRRMQLDADRMRVPFTLSAEELERQLLKLVEANRAFNATLRVSIVRNRGGSFEGAGIVRDTDLIAFTAPLRDWGAGVALTYVPHGRHGASRFAGAKITSWANNLTIYEEVHERGFDEAILLNEDGQVSECTSANIFIVRDRHVLTPPLSTSGCLPGVTRSILLDDIRIPGIHVSEAEITPSELEQADQVFITSTTRDLLPVMAVDGHTLSQQPATLATLNRAFASYRDQYIENHARKSHTLPV
jgi:branched-chain amino acid aminotransferase